MVRSQKLKTKLLKVKFFSKLFLAAALIFIGVFFIGYSSRSYFTKLTSTNIIKSENQTKPQPIKIIAPKINKSLNITAGEFSNNRWTVAEKGVSYLITSKLPGEGGNSVIYGHNKKEIFGNLNNLKTDDTVYIILNNGQIVKYQVFETKEVKPNQTEILNETNDNRLTVYTCSGFLDEARFVVLAKQVSIS